MILLRFGSNNNKCEFLTDIQEEYEELKESKESEPVDCSQDCLDLLNKDAVDLVLKQLNKKELEKIKQSHTALSIAVGRKIGVLEVNDDIIFSPTDYSEAILESIYEVRYSGISKYSITRALIYIIIQTYSD